MEYKEIFTKKRACPFDAPKEGDIIIKNKSAYVTYAIAPYHKDHLLIVPFRHIVEILDITPKEQKDLDVLLDKMWNLFKKKLKYRSVSFLLREGKSSGASVGHLHYHIIPDVRIGDMEKDFISDTRSVLDPKGIVKEVMRMRKLAK